MNQRADAAAVRLSVGRLLAGADLRPPAMPPSAILVVRRMTDPQPGRIAAGRRATTVHREWERRAREQLADLYRRAARPARGFVPDSAEAVCFADESELLACLARDMRSGVVGQRWWWRSTLRQMGSFAAPVDLLVERLIARAELVPAVLARLDEWGDAVQIVERFSPAQVVHILAATLIAHRLPDLIPGRKDHVGMVSGARAQPLGSATSTYVSLSREQAALLGIALDLRRHPYRVHAPDYALRLYAWWRAAAMPSRSAETPTTGNYVAPPEGSRRADRQTSTPNELSAAMPLTAATSQMEKPSLGFKVEPPEPRVDPPAHPLTMNLDRVDHGVESAPPERVARPQPSPADALPVELSSVPAPPSAHPPAVAPEDPPQRNKETAVEPALPAPLTTAEPSIDAAPSPVLTERAWPAEGLPTRVGGVLYLINLMLALDLPESGEEGWQLASGVGPWGLLAALGRELLGDDFAAVEADPLWLALALLDSRPPGEQPGFRLPHSRPRRWPTFEIPADWRQGSAAPTNDHVVRWWISGHYRPLLARWLSLALPFVDWRLRAALHLPADTRLAEELFLLPGQLYITASQIDLVTSLERISLPVRMAGLDRNPGWLPGWGRAVYFHFQ